MRATVLASVGLFMASPLVTGQRNGTNRYTRVHLSEHIGKLFIIFKYSFISNYIVLLELYFLTLKLEAFGSLICACYHLLDGAKMCYSVRSIFSTRLDKISL